MYKKYLFLVIWYGLFQCFYLPILIAGTTGKISGTVIEKDTGAPIPGANVIVVGTPMGAAADLDGNYTILHVPPGAYSVKASVIGYTILTVSEVRVLIDQTTRIDFQLKSEVLEGETITVVAERKPVQVDVSTSVSAVSTNDIKELPVASVTSVVGLQAGIQGMNIRGSSDDKSLFMVDGVTMRDPRNNKPISTLPLSSVQEVSIQRGGFNAEYGQVQSGIVNVVTKEGNKDKYTITMDMKYAAPQEKHFDISPFDRNSMWFRPYLDNAVCWEGTGKWNKYTARQYPGFEGWNEISRRLLENSDPTDDLSPAGAQRVWLWEHRKEPVTDAADYNLDAGIGGPVPIIGKKLGGLRFYSSFRRQRELLLVPLNRDDYVEWDLQNQVTSDLTTSMKLRFSTLSGKRYTVADNWVQGWYLRSGQDIASRINAYKASGLFSTGYFSPADISHQTYSLKLTHTLSPSTFYESSLEHIMRDYYVRAADRFNTSKRHEIVPGYFVNDAPFGFFPGPIVGIAGMDMGGHFCRQRDNSKVSMTTFKADLTSQVNFQNLVKAGLEFVYNTLDMDYGFTDMTGNYGDRVQRNDNPIRAAFYLQDKLEAKGFIVNAGLRLDYSNANTNWYALDPFDEQFFSTSYSPTIVYQIEKTTGQYQLSPRLGISHPITENSKLFFNYGHFKQMPTYEALFRMSRSASNLLGSFGDPNLTLAKTIAYELGYDHAISDRFLFQLAAYYKDISDQERTVRYYGLQSVEYDKITSNGYSDIRGFEITLRKTYGEYWKGFANYTYQVTTDGHFEGERVYQDPKKQSDYDKDTRNFWQQKPVPTPYARINVQFFTPRNFGSRVAGLYPLSNLLLSLIGNWQDGGFTTWNPKNSAIRNNVRVVNWYNFDIRFEKNIRFKFLDVNLYVDVYNLFNTRRLARLYDDVLAGFWDYQDRVDYWDSLHLPKNQAYDNIPGDDKFGDYRKPDVSFQPIEARGKINIDSDKGDAGVIYWERVSKKYLEYVDGKWLEVASNRMNKIIDEKAYIDMPNQTSFSFLNPRQIFYGLRINFNF